MIENQIFYTIVIGWTAFGILLFPVILRVTAPYGRHAKSNWGPMIGNRLGWFIMESPALFLVTYLVLKGKSLQNQVVIIFFLLWLLHYFHRTIIFPFRIKTKGKKMPILIMLFAFIFNLINGFIIGNWMGFLTDDYTMIWLRDPRFIAGVFLFLSGFAINQYHDWILIKLRKSDSGTYKIPFGGMFRFVSCPNFLGEIIEWGGFALLTWCLPSLSFFIWTIINLLPRAMDHHKWYLKNFTEYPAGRKAIIPFVL